MNSFADRLQASIEKSGSVLVAGCDPVIDALPPFLLAEATRRHNTDQGIISHVLESFGEAFLAAIAGNVAAVKPNIAFFEQYGLAGLSAFEKLCREIRAQGIPVITDAKRGDIGSTAAAYSAAYLGQATVGGKPYRAFETDALTISPFLGFDTLEPFLKDCVLHGKGLFVLVQTSNPGAKALQGLSADGSTVSQHVARWLAQHAEKLQGACGWSGLGAVVGASYPQEAKDLRAVMQTNFFLIPGLGAQGAGAEDAVAGFASRDGKRGGALVNASRGLLTGSCSNLEELQQLIRANAKKFNAELNQALAS